MPLLRLADEMDALASRCIDNWLAHAPDPRGAVFGHLDRRMRPVFDSEGLPQGSSGEHRGDKTLIQVSRHLYAYSLMARRRGTSSALEDVCRSCFEVLSTAFFRAPQAPLLHQLTASHEPRDDRVQMYAQSFAIFGLSAYARAFDVPQAAELALELFGAVDARRHDGDHGGYDQADDGGWLGHVCAPEGANKCTNTHIHVLEALTELSHVRPEAQLVTDRLQELTRLLATRMTQPEGYVAKFFDREWRPVGPTEVSYGHDIETSWLLRDAADRLAELGDEAVHARASDSADRMARHALAAGWDPAGGMFDFGLPLSERSSDPSDLSHVTGTEKVWWAQAEALPGIYALFRSTSDGALPGQLRATFDFLQEKCFDSEYGEFYWAVDSQGAIGPRGDHKGEIWKTPYHAVRALILTSDWIRADLAND